MTHVLTFLFLAVVLVWLVFADHAAADDRAADAERWLSEARCHELRDDR